MSTDRHLATGLVAGGAIGLVASGVLLVERLRLAQDSEYVPSCSISPIISCGSIMESAQASLLGFPNPIIGLVAFPVLITTGFAIHAGARLARWYWLGLQVGSTVAVGFICWLIFQSLYRINALCPYCMIVWAVVLPTFWYVTLRNLAQGTFGAAAASSRWSTRVRAWHAPVLLGVYLAILALITVRFWSYWATLV